MERVQWDHEDVEMPQAPRTWMSCPIQSHAHILLRWYIFVDWFPLLLGSRDLWRYRKRLSRGLSLSALSLSLSHAHSTHTHSLALHSHSCAGTHTDVYPHVYYICKYVITRARLHKQFLLPYPMEHVAVEVVEDTPQGRCDGKVIIGDPGMCDGLDSCMRWLVRTTLRDEGLK